MAQAAIPAPIAVNKTASDAFVSFFQQCKEQYFQSYSIRGCLEIVDRSYAREGNLGTDQNRSLILNRLGDKSKIQDFTIPVVMPQTETALAHLAMVFLSDVPMFKVVGDPKTEDAALMMNTVLMDNSIEGGWLREFLLTFRDGLKYNLQAVEVEWCTEKTYSVQTDLTFDAKIGKPVQINWEGNRIKRLDMYNTIFDTRYVPADLAKKGEFSGYVDLMSRIELKRFIANLKEAYLIKGNLTAAYTAPATGPIISNNTEGYFIPTINPNAFIQRQQMATTNWLAWAGAEARKKMEYRNIYELWTLYGRIIPSEFSLFVPARNSPQIWKLHFVGQVPIYAERMTNAHDLLPTIFGQPLEDGLGYQTKSFASHLEPIQDLASALTNARIASARRRVTDRLLYDATRIREADINDPSPTAKIPVRPSAYNRNVSEAAYQFPFRDDNAAMFTQEAAGVVDYGRELVGTNRPMQGMFQKGNKTVPEFQRTMMGGDMRMQLLALFEEAQFMGPLKKILKLNTLQYQPEVQLYNAQEGKTVDVKPTDLRKAVMSFKVTDGMLPADKVVNMEFLGTMMQTIATTPQLMIEFDLVKMWSYFAKLQYMQPLDAFRRTPEEQKAVVSQMQAVQGQQQGQQPGAGQPAGAPNGTAP